MRIRHVDVDEKQKLEEIEINDTEAKRKLNLTPLVWMGLTCQASGVLFALGCMVQILTPTGTL